MGALLITLREGIEAALIIGIILTYLRKTGRVSLRKYVFVGLGSAFVASLGIGALFQILGMDPDNPMLEGIMMGVAGLFVASMVIWMWRTAKGLKHEMENRLDDIVASKTATGLAAGIGILLFAFVMVLREGIEMVLFLSALGIGARSNLVSFAGGAVGLGMAVAFAILLVRGSLVINFSRFLSVTSVVLLLLAAKFLAASAYEFGELGILPVPGDVMGLLGYLASDGTSSIIITALAAVPIVLLLWDLTRAKRAPATCQ